MLVDNHLTRPHVSMLGTSALLFEAPGEFSLATQRRIWTLARTAAAWPGVREGGTLHDQCHAHLRHPPRSRNGSRRRCSPPGGRRARPTEGRVVDVPVIYGGEYGPDLLEIAAHAKLPPEEVVRLHTASRLIVFAIGSHPGNAYLGGSIRASPCRGARCRRAGGGRHRLDRRVAGGHGRHAGAERLELARPHDLPVFDPHRDPPRCSRRATSCASTRSG